jgi:hypothetical protein
MLTCAEADKVFVRQHFATDARFEALAEGYEVNGAVGVGKAYLDGVSSAQAGFTAPGLGM